MAWCFSFPLQALPVWSLLPVFLPTLRAEEPRSYALQWQTFQVWLLWSCLCWCHNPQQPHPDTHWRKALQVSTWSQQPLPADIREGHASLLFTSITSPYRHPADIPLKAKVRPPDKFVSGVAKIRINPGLFLGAFQALSNFLSSNENLF